MIRITFDIPDEFRSPNTVASSKADTPPFPDLSALELVAKAQREFESGDDRQWAASLWAAVHKTFLHLAKSEFIESKDLIDIAEALDRQGHSPARYHTGQLITGMMLREHCQSGALEAYWHNDVHDDMVSFVRDRHAAAP
jgi:hypothetical protein